jgi:cysteine desulfurase
MREAYGNASSIHEEGRRARRLLEEARETVASMIGAGAKEIIFTSGGTESNNTALRGAASRSSELCHIVTTSIEHPSVLATALRLRDEGFGVTVIPCNARGVVEPDVVIGAITPATRIVAVMLANNETGVIQPVAEIAAHCRERGVHVHCDAVQGAGRIPIDVAALGVDTLSIASHKMHGPKGIGALYVRKGVTLAPLISGGAQERRRRAGTETVPLAVGFATAAGLAAKDRDAARRMGAMRDRLESELLSSLPFARVNGGEAPRLPNTSSLCFAGHDAEGIVIGLDLEGIAVSTGSACSSGRVEPSHVLLAMGLSEEDARSSVRISLGQLTVDDEIRRAVDCLRHVVPRNRKQQATDGVPLAVTPSKE